MYFGFALLVLVGLFFFFQPQTNIKNQNKIQAPQKTFAIVIKGKKIITGQKKISVRQYDTVVIDILSDEPDEFHLHGYNKAVDLEANKKETLRFSATKTGRFPFELEKSQTELGVVEVEP
jgi:hypothetical protein